MLKLGGCVLLFVCQSLLIPTAICSEVRIEVAFPNLTFDKPVDLQHSPDGSNRLFVVEQRGMIQLFQNSPGVKEKEVFLDIRDRVLYGGEMGLLGLAFHPEYADSGYFYVNYTAPNPRRTVISRFSVSGGNPDLADINSEFVILEVAQPYSNHNGGQIVFGPDGYLYIGMGDGGSGGDPQGNGQNLKTLLGSLLRIDVDDPGVPLSVNYGIPTDNPFKGNSQGFKEEIFAYGLRNPWRFSFDPQTGWLWLADVGQRKYEEIDIIDSGHNYGWNIMEGFQCYEPPQDCDTAGLTMPIWEYGRGHGTSITGGFVYRGSEISELYGKYVYADWGSGTVWSLTYEGINPPVNVVLKGLGEHSVTSFGVDEKNRLFICSFDGRIYRINHEPMAGAQALVMEEDSELVISLAGTDPDSDHITFEIVSLPLKGQLFQTADGVGRGETITSVPVNVLNDDGNVIYVPERDENGDDYSDFSFRVSDPWSVSNEATVSLAVNHVNDPPEPFSLLFPSDGDTLSSAVIEFSWQVSYDVDLDPIEYTVYVVGEGLELTIESLPDTIHRFNAASYLASGAFYSWFVEATDGIDTTSSSSAFDFFAAHFADVGGEDPVPSRFKLYPNFPNPFNAVTTIFFELPAGGTVDLAIHDLSGREVARPIRRWKGAGRHELEWDASGLPSGIYFYRLGVEQDGILVYKESRKMVVLK